MRRVLYSAVLLCALQSPAAAQGAGAGADAVPEAPRTPQLTRAPVLTEWHEAGYPEAALAQSISARVLLNLVLDTEGVVQEATVAEFSAPTEVASELRELFEQSALEAGLMLVFSPAEIDDQPASVELQFAYDFHPPAPIEAAPAATQAGEATQASPTTEAQQSLGRLTGTLLEAGTRRPLPGLRVTLEDRGEETYTDEAGRFSFEQLSAGPADVHIEDDVYAAVVDRAQIAAGEETRIRYYLEKIAFENMAVVRAQRPQREVTRHSLDIQEIRSLPGSSGDALRVVQNLPGAARIPFGGGGLVLRGGGRSRAFVDGMPIPAPFHFGGLRSTLASALIESLDVHPGNFDAEFGRINGGIIDLRLRDPRRDGIHGYVEADVFDAGFLIEAPLGEHGSIAVAGRRSYIDLLLPLFLPEDARATFSTAPRYYDTQLLYAYRKGKNHVRALFFLSDDRLVATIEQPPDNAPTLHGDANFRMSFYGGSVHWNHRFSGDVQHELGLAYYHQPIEFGVADFLQLDLSNHIITLRDQLNLKLRSDLSLSVGTDSELNFGGASGLGGAPPSEGQRGGFNNTKPTRVPDLSYLYLTPALWSRLEYTHGALSVIPSLRMEYFGAVDQAVFQPRLTARYALNDQWTLKAAAGAYAQQVNGSYITEGVGNPDLNVETSAHYSAGLLYRITEALSLDLTAFYKDLFDLVRPVDNPNIRFDNRGTGRAYGAELLLRHELTERLYGWIAYTWMRSERRDEPGEAMRVFDFDQTHNLVLVGTYKLTPTWQFGLRFRFVSGNPTTPVIGGTYNADSGSYSARYGEVNSERLEPFHQLDLRVDKLWVFDTWQLVSYLEVQNLYNRANPEGISYNHDFTQSQVIGSLPIIPSFGLRGQF